MQPPDISPLREEMSKLTGFLVPSDVKSAAVEAMNFLNNKKSIPITEKDNPVTRLLRIVFSNQKYIRVNNGLISKGIDSIRSNVFIDDSLAEICYLYSTIVYCIDIESATRFLQHSTNAVVQDFPSLSRIKSCFSLTLSLMGHPEEMISSTAIASFQQMLAILVDSSSKCDSQSPKLLKFANYVQKLFPDIMCHLKNQIYIILYLIISDLIKIALDEPLQWLNLYEPPKFLIFDLLNEIIRSYSVILHEDHFLGQLFETVVLRVLENPESIPFIVAFVDVFLDVYPQLCTSLFNEYFQFFQYDNKYVSLFFFHTFMLQKTDLTYRFFSICDQSMSLYNPLLCTLINCFEYPATTIDLPMKLVKLNDVKTGTTAYEVVASIEITFAIIDSFSKYNDNQVQDFFSKSLQIILSILISSLKCSTVRSFNVVTSHFLKFISILQNFGLIRRARGNFTTLSMMLGQMNAREKEKYEINAKSPLWTKFLGKLLISSPGIVQEDWSTYIPIMLESGIKSSFANEFDAITVMDIIDALLLINPFPSEFVGKFLESNIDRFQIIWPVFESSILKTFHKKHVYDHSLFQLLISMMANMFYSSTELEILRLCLYFQKLISFPKSSYITMLEQLQATFQTKQNEIKEGWPLIIEILSPELCTDSQNINLLFFTMKQISGALSDKPDGIKLMFDFVSQKIDDKVSLAALKLVSGLTHDFMNLDLWTDVFSHYAKISSDKRPLIAKAAIKAFFEMFATAYDCIPPALIEQYIDHGFTAFLDKLRNVENVTELGYNSLAYFCCRQWDLLRENDRFETAFIPFVVKRRESLDLDGYSNFILIYYQSKINEPEVEYIFRESISRKIADIPENEAYEIFNTVLVNHKDKIAIEEWVPIITKYLNTNPSNSDEVKKMCAGILNTYRDK